MIYRCSSSVPALRGMGLLCDAASASLPLLSRFRVSEIVVTLEADKAAMSDSMAAMAGVIEGSVSIRRL